MEEKEPTYQVILTMSCLHNPIPLGPFDWNDAVTTRVDWVNSVDGHLIMHATIRCIETGEVWQ